MIGLVSVGLRITCIRVTVVTLQGAPEGDVPEDERGAFTAPFNVSVPVPRAFRALHPPF